MISLDIMEIFNTINGNKARKAMAGDKAVAVLAKPVMRNLLHSQIKLNLTIAIGLGIASAVAFKVLVADARKKKYAEFYRTYDADAVFEDMRKKGVFQSC